MWPASTPLWKAAFVVDPLLPTAATIALFLALVVNDPACDVRLTRTLLGILATTTKTTTIGAGAGAGAEGGVVAIGEGPLRNTNPNLQVEKEKEWARGEGSDFFPRPSGKGG